MVILMWDGIFSTKLFLPNLPFFASKKNWNSVTLKQCSPRLRIFSLSSCIPRAEHGSKASLHGKKHPNSKAHSLLVRNLPAQFTVYNQLVSNWRSVDSFLGKFAECWDWHGPVARCCTNFVAYYKFWLDVNLCKLDVDFLYESKWKLVSAPCLLWSARPVKSYKLSSKDTFKERFPFWRVWCRRCESKHWSLKVGV